MDIKNQFHTKSTYFLMRLDYFIVMVFSLSLLYFHIDEISWPVFIVAIAWQDIFGYIPAAIIYYFIKKGPVRKMAKVFYILYNLTHSIAGNLVFLLVWVVLRGGWGWEMLALPIHIGFDRSIPGNVFKSFSLSFEPVMNKEYEEFKRKFNEKAHWGASI